MMICTKYTEYLQPPFRAILNRFDRNPVAVRLPAFIAVGSGGDFGARNGHGGFGHAVLEWERRACENGPLFQSAAPRRDPGDLRSR